LPVFGFFLRHQPRTEFITYLSNLLPHWNKTPPSVMSILTVTVIMTISGRSRTKTTASSCLLPRMPTLPL
jgi:hypothetical protein